jgi:hypothetical protein
VTEPFTPIGNRQWSVGDPAAPDLIWGGIDAEGTEWVVSDPVGWYASPPVELGLEDKAGDGAWFGRGAYKARVLEVNGAFRVCRGGIDRLEEIAARLQELFDPRRDTILSVNEAIPKQITVRPASEVDVHPVPRQTRARTFRITLTAGDPWKYQAGATGLTTVELRLLNPAAMPGMTHDAEHPLDHGGVDLAALGWAADAVNIGQEAAWTQLRFIGPAANPTLTNVTTGEFFTLGRTLGAGVEAVIDAELRTVRVGGSSDFGAKAPRSTFLSLAKGTNDLRFTADAYQADARAYVSWRPRWK